MGSCRRSRQLYGRTYVIVSWLADNVGNYNKAWPLSETKQVEQLPGHRDTLINFCPVAAMRPGTQVHWCRVRGLLWLLVSGHCVPYEYYSDSVTGLPKSALSHRGQYSLSDLVQILTSGFQEYFHRVESSLNSLAP